MPRVKITADVIEAQKPDPERDVLLWDTKLKGFGVKVTPSGSKSFFAFYRTREGKQRRPTIGPWPTWTVEAARKEANQYIAGGDRGEDRLGDKRKARTAASQRLSMRDFCKRYLEDFSKPHKKTSSYTGDKARIERYILPALGGRGVAEVERADVQRLHAGLHAIPRGGNLVLSLLRAMFGIAEQWGLRLEGSNPAKGIKPYPERRRERLLRPDELARLGDALAKFEVERTYSQAAIDGIRLLILTGCRRNEILTLRWGCVDLQGGFLDLEDSKVGPRRVVLGKAAVAYFLLMAERGGLGEWVCPGAVPNKPINNVRGTWRAALKATGITDARLHDCRHAFASAGVGLGISTTQIKGLLGHKSERMTARYIHQSDDFVRAGGDTISDHLANLLKGGGARVVEIQSGGEAKESGQTQ